MRPHPRIRKTVKWGGLLATGALTAFSFWSMNKYCGYDFSEGAVCVLAGRLRVEWWQLGPGGTGHFGPWIQPGPGFQPPWFSAYRPWGKGCCVIVPVWLVPAGTLSLTLLAWHLDGRARTLPETNPCHKCGYSRAGLAPTAPCPECGSPPA